MAKYEEQCGSCEYFFDKRGNCDEPYDTDYYEQGYCSWYKCFYWADDSCGHHKKRGSKTSWSICYITTIVCHILGLEDNCPELELLRSLRNDVLQKDEKYQSILYEYDVIGPQIAGKIMKDYEEKQDKEFATLLFNFYIQPSAWLYEEEKVDESITRYKEMTDSLAETFGIEKPTKIPNDYDMTKGGHGEVKQKKLGTYPKIEKNLQEI